ncbi:SYT14 protein, partial [Polypterus senegalus]
MLRTRLMPYQGDQLHMAHLCGATLRVNGGDHIGRHVLGPIAQATLRLWPATLLFSKTPQGHRQLFSIVSPVSPEALGFLSAVGVFVVLMVVLLLYLNNKLCFGNIGELSRLDDYRKSKDVPGWRVAVNEHRGAPPLKFQGIPWAWSPHVDKPLETFLLILCSGGEVQSKCGRQRRRQESLARGH